MKALPITGGTLTGNLTIKGSDNYGTKINLGDGDLVHLAEPTDDVLEIKAKSLLFETMSQASTKPLPVNQDGTGASTAAAARTALGAASSSHTHSQYASSTHTHTASQVGAVPTTRKVNGKVLSGDISLTTSEVGAAASDHTHTASQITGAGNCEVYLTMYTGDGQDSRSWTFPHRPMVVFYTQPSVPSPYTPCETPNSALPSAKSGTGTQD